MPNDDRPHADFVMPFGQHEGKPLCQLSEDYLRWLITRTKGNIRRVVSEFLGLSVAEDQTSHLIPVQCPQCHRAGPLSLSWQVFGNGGRHIRGCCQACNQFVRFIQKTTAAIAECDRQTAERTATTCSTLGLEGQA
jgi:uncharacterized protein (DUF3820 family)